MPTATARPASTVSSATLAPVVASGPPPPGPGAAVAPGSEARRRRRGRGVVVVGHGARHGVVGPDVDDVVLDGERRALPVDALPPERGVAGGTLLGQRVRPLLDGHRRDVVAPRRPGDDEVAGLGDPDAVSVQSAGAAVPPSSLTTSLTSVSIGGHDLVRDAHLPRRRPRGRREGQRLVDRLPVDRRHARTGEDAARGEVVVSSTTTSCAPAYPPRSVPHGWALGAAPSGPVSVSAASRPSGCSPSA